MMYIKIIFLFLTRRKKPPCLWSNSGPTAASNYSELPKRCYLVLCLPVYILYVGPN